MASAAVNTRPMGKHGTFWPNVLAFAVIAVAVGWFCHLVFTILSPQWRWDQLWKHRQPLIDGWQMTFWLSVASLAGSLLLGVGFMLGQRSPWVVVRKFCRGFLELVRALPLLVLLMVGYFVIFAPLLSRWLVAHGLPEKAVIGGLLLWIFGGAYLGEILRGGVDSIPRTQWDAARAVGFDRWQVYRHVIAPQALRRVLPAVAGQFMSLIKDSSLLSVIGVQEFAYQQKYYASVTYGGLEVYVPLALGYLVLTLPVAWISHRLEQRFRDEI